MDWDHDHDHDYDHRILVRNSNPSSFTTTSTTTKFDKYYMSYPLSTISKTHLESGNKIMMPASALDHLASLEIVYPMVFRIENASNGRHSHCGVVEFTADEGFEFLPTWMMDNMGLRQGELVNIKNTSLPKGKYIKIQPHATKFMALSNHKSLLETSFRDFVCLTRGETIMINHEGEKYVIDLLETKPSPAVSMFETDCVVDFATPLDRKGPEMGTRVNLKRKNNGLDEDRSTRKLDDEVNLFPGIGRRLDGMKVGEDNESVNQSMKKLKITNDSKMVDGKPKNEEKIEFRPFCGVAKRVDGQQFGAEEVVLMDKSKIQANMIGEHRELKPFTGKSYRVLG